MKKIIRKTGLIFGLIVLLITGVNAYAYYTVDYGDTVTLCDGCSIVSDNEYYFMYVDSIGKVTITKRLGEASYSDIKVINIDNIKNIQYGDMYIESGAVHICIVENSTGNSRIYYAGYGTDVSDGQVKLTGGQCSIVEGADGYPHIFNGVNEYRWDGGAWVEDSNVFSADFNGVSDVIMNGSDYWAWGRYSSAPTYNRGVLDFRSSDSGNFINKVFAYGVLGSQAGILRFYDISGDGNNELIMMGGRCSGGTGYVEIGVYNGSNFRNVTTLKTLADGSNCNKHIIDASLTKLGDTYYAYYTDTDSTDDLLVSEGNFNSWSESTAIATLNGEMYFSADSDSDEEYLLYDDNSTTSVIRIRYEVPTYSLSGYVYDADTGNVIPTQPSITLDKGGVTSSDLCDLDGYYELTNLEGGTYNYTVEDTGYMSQSGTINIESDIADNNYYLQDNDTDTSTNYYRILFVDKDKLQPVKSNGVKFTYKEGSECNIGTEYIRTTNSLGKASGFLPIGTYDLELLGYSIYDEDGFLKTDIEINLGSDYYKTYYVTKGNRTATKSFIFLDSENFAEISNVSLQVFNDKYYDNGTSDENGTVDITLPQGTYSILATHPNYYSYPLDEHYYNRTVTISNNTYEYIYLINQSADKFYVCGNVTDYYEDITISGAIVEIYNNDEYYKNVTTDSGNYCIYNLSGSYEIKTSNSSYKTDYQSLYVQQNIDDKNIKLKKESDIPSYCISGIVSSSGTALKSAEIKIESELTGLDDYVYSYVYTDSIGNYSVCNLNEFTQYELTVKENGYEVNVTTVYVESDNVTQDFDLDKITIAHNFAGYIYDSESNEPIENANVYLYQDTGNDSYVRSSDSGGYFSFRDLEQGDYQVSIRKTFYHRDDTLLTLDSDKTITYNLDPTESQHQLNLLFTDENGTTLPNVRCSLKSEYIEDMGSSDNDGKLSFTVITGEYALEYNKEGYNGGEKTVFVDESHNYYRIELVKSVESESHKYTKEEINDWLYRNVPPIFMILIFVAFLTAMTSANSKSSG